MSALAAMLILAYSPLDWSFPWWLWALFIVIDLPQAERNVRLVVKERS
jgi:hypothetical protein